MGLFYRSPGVAVESDFFVRGSLLPNDVTTAFLWGEFSVGRSFEHAELGRLAPYDKVFFLCGEQTTSRSILLLICDVPIKILYPAHKIFRALLNFGRGSTLPK